MVVASTPERCAASEIFMNASVDGSLTSSPLEVLARNHAGLAAQRSRSAIHVGDGRDCFMKRKSATLVLLGSLSLLASGQDANHHSSVDHNHTEAAVSAHDQHGSTHSGTAGFKLEFENEPVQVVRIKWRCSNGGMR